MRVCFRHTLWDENSKIKSIYAWFHISLYLFIQFIYLPILNAWLCAAYKVNKNRTRNTSSWWIIKVHITAKKQVTSHRPGTESNLQSLVEGQKGRPQSNLRGVDISEGGWQGRKRSFFEPATSIFLGWWHFQYAPLARSEQMDRNNKEETVP